MNHLQIERAEKLDDMLRAFRLEPLDESELSRFYCDKTMVIRTGDQWSSPMDDLFDACTTPLARNAHILLGHRGCGKSTELYNLKKRFEQVGQPMQIIDVITDTDIFQITYWDIIILITDGLFKIANDNSLMLPGKILERVHNYLNNILVRITESGGSTFFSKEGRLEVATSYRLLNTFAAIKGEMKCSLSSRRIIIEEMERHVAVWVYYAKEISDRISDLVKQPILIFENTDKIQPLERVFNVFCHSILAQMPFPVIYTFPISSYNDSQFSSIKDLYKPHILPMIRVKNTDGCECKDGIDVILEIVNLRADSSLFDNTALHMLIRQTGGVLRDLFTCITSATRRANRRGANKIEVEDAEQALLVLKSELARQNTRIDVLPSKLDVKNER
ncbi:MAG: hypothetical protein FWF85_08595 [Clostridiales bacterium]|nr:hypothetical protein [Clostridiales bacterium]